MDKKWKRHFMINFGSGPMPLPLAKEGVRLMKLLVKEMGLLERRVKRGRVSAAADRRVNKLYGQENKLRQQIAAYQHKAYRERVKNQFNLLFRSEEDECIPYSLAKRGILHVRLYLTRRDQYSKTGKAEDLGAALDALYPELFDILDDIGRFQAGL